MIMQLQGIFKDTYCNIFNSKHFILYSTNNKTIHIKIHRSIPHDFEIGLIGINATDWSYFGK